MPTSPATLTSRATTTVLAISDVHGHHTDLVTALRGAGVIDAAGHWCGGDTQLHVLGDLLDRGPDGLRVIRLLRRLQAEAPGSVHVLLGNHEILAMAVWLFPGEGFEHAWRRSGGIATDQAGLTHVDISWLQSLPVLARAGDDLLAHSDSSAYLDWGRTLDGVNDVVTQMLATDDPDAYRDLWRGLTQRRRFTGPRGPARVRDLLTAFGGTRLVHGHSIVDTLGGSAEPLAYADGLALAIDGGRYEGGPLLLVDLSPAG